MRPAAGYVPAMTEKTASFGFREVPEDRKEGLVKEVFSSVAARYDLMNDLMSAGVHRIWKDAMVEWLNPQPGWKTLDVAGGTGDIAFRIVDMARSRGAARQPSRSATSMPADAGRGRAPRRRKGRGAPSNGCAAMPKACRSPSAFRRLYHRLRHPQCDPYRQGAGAKRAGC